MSTQSKALDATDLYFLLWSHLNNSTKWVHHQITHINRIYEDNFFSMISKYIYMIKDLSYIPNPLTLTHKSLNIPSWNEITQLHIMNLIESEFRHHQCYLEWVSTDLIAIQIRTQKCSLHIKDKLIKIVFLLGTHQFYIHIQIWISKPMLKRASRGD